MTRASMSKVNRKAARQNVAKTAQQVAAHGRVIEVDGMKFVAIPESAYQVVMAALQTLARA